MEKTPSRPLFWLFPLFFSFSVMAAKQGGGDPPKLQISKIQIVDLGGFSQAALAAVVVDPSKDVLLSWNHQEPYASYTIQGATTPNGVYEDIVTYTTEDLFYPEDGQEVTVGIGGKPTDAKFFFRLKGETP